MGRVNVFLGGSRIGLNFARPDGYRRPRETSSRDGAVSAVVVEHDDPVVTPSPVVVAEARQIPLARAQEAPALTIRELPAE